VTAFEQQYTSVQLKRKVLSSTDSELPLDACFVPAITTYFDQVIDTVVAHQSLKQNSRIAPGSQWVETVVIVELLRLFVGARSQMKRTAATQAATPEEIVQ
jgi:hypothetical protein